MLTLALTALALPASSPPQEIRVRSREVQQMAWGDFNADGRLDVYVSHASGDHLYRNVGGGDFEELALGLESGSRFARWQDFDGDGRLDLYLASDPAPGRLLRNLGEGLFEDVTSGSGLPADFGPVESARWFDFDGDGSMDLLLTGATGSRLLRNDGNGVFQPVQLELRTMPAAPPGPTLAVAGEEEPAPTTAGASARGTTGRRPVPIDVSVPGREETGVPPWSLPKITSFDLVGSFTNCPQSISDQAGAGCLRASSEPTLGMLYPLSSALFIDPVGYVGMGTTSPFEPLHVTGNIRADGDVLANFGTATDPAYRFGPGLEATGLSSPNPETLALITSGAEAVRIDSFGRVGIGTLAPAAPLHVITTEQTAILGETDANGFEAAVRGTANRVAGLGVEGSSPGLEGVGVLGRHASTSWIAGAGVSGTSSGAGSVIDGIGVAGFAPEELRDDSGVFGWTRSTSSGSGVFGLHSSNTGRGAGVLGHTNSTSQSAVGVRGIVISSTPGGFSAGVRGINQSTTGNGIGVYGVHEGDGWGVYGNAVGPSGIGVRGTGGLWAVLAEGDLGASGTKSFVQPHPTDASKEVRFVCLEGNESGTYFRGSSRLVNGAALIEVPEEFRLVSEIEGLTVQVTALGDARVWVERKSLERIEVRARLRRLRDDPPEHELRTGVRKRAVRQGTAGVTARDPRGERDPQRRLHAQRRHRGASGLAAAREARAAAGDRAAQADRATLSGGPAGSYSSIALTSASASASSRACHSSSSSASWYARSKAAYAASWFPSCASAMARNT